MKKTLLFTSLLMLMTTFGFSQQFQNLINNPAAHYSTLDGWTIENNWGDGWGIKDIDGTDNTPCFITSWDWDSKYQVIDLVSLGYSIDILDNEPIVLFAEKYKGAAYGSSTDDLYELNIYLRDANGNNIAVFNSGILTCSDNWQTIKGTFRNYGPGLRYIVYQHAGKGVDFWAGHYGAMIDDSHLSIVNNVYYAGGKTHSFSGWEITENWGDGWIIDENGWYKTSYGANTKNQVIDLLGLGYTTTELDSEPNINIGEWVKGNEPDYADFYWMTLQLLNGNMEVIDQYELSINTTQEWQWVGASFDDYGAGLRYIRFEHGGYDAEIWTGHYGANMDFAFVDIVIDNSVGIIDPNETQTMNMSIYPNPAIDHFTLKLYPGEWNNTKLVISDYTGKIVYEEYLGDISNQAFYKNMTFNSLKKGIYVVKVYSDKGQQTSRLIIK